MPNDTEKNASFQDLFLRGVFMFGGEKVNDDAALHALGVGSESHVELIQQRVPRPNEVGTEDYYIATLDEEGHISTRRGKNADKYKGKNFFLYSKHLFY